VNAPDALQMLGGFGTRNELLAVGCNEWLIDLGLYYGKILRVRVGQYALLDTPAPIIRALAVGGRLACVSAVAYLAGRPVEGPLHIVVAYGKSRLGPRAPGEVVVHWTRRALDGNRLTVSAEVAAQQARHCTRAAIR
jgi:hypothetical protein